MPIRHFVVFQTRLRLLLYHQLDTVLRYKLLLSQRGFNEAASAVKPIFFSDVRASPTFTKPFEHHSLFNFCIGANQRAPIVFWCSSHRNTLETSDFFLDVCSFNETRRSYGWYARALMIFTHSLSAILIVSNRYINRAQCRNNTCSKVLCS